MAAVALFLLAATKSSGTAWAFQPLLTNHGGLVKGGTTQTYRHQQAAKAGVRTRSPPGSLGPRYWRSASLSTTAAQREGDDFFFDREMETKDLLRYLTGGPKAVSVVVGPQNSGKTRLLEGVLYSRQLPPIHLDARMDPITSSGDLIDALHTVGVRWLESERTKKCLGRAAKEFLRSLKQSLADFNTIKSLEAVGTGTGLTAITNVLRVHGSMLRAARANNVVTEAPVIWIDEVNALLEWRRKDRHEIMALLRFFKLVRRLPRWPLAPWWGSRRLCLCLCQCLGISELGLEYMDTTVIGDLTEEAARRFAQEYMNNLGRECGNAPLDIADLEWTMIYQVCGGNPYELRRAMGEWHSVTSPKEGAPRMDLLETALSEVWRRRYNQLRRAVDANPTFAFVAHQLCSASYGGVPRIDLDTALSKEGLGSVEQLMQDNLVAVRPKSPYAPDLPVEVFGDDCYEVVTACSAVELYCLKRMQVRAHWQSKQVPMQLG